MSKYVIRVEGALSSALVSAFPALESSQHVQTLLHGTLEDQSELADVLAHLRDLGVDVVEVRRLPAPDRVTHAHGKPLDSEAS